MERIALSQAVYDEIVDVLFRPRLARFVRPALREWLLAELAIVSVWFAITERVTACRDPKDDKVLELAVAATARIIVSSDADLVTMSPWRGITIVRPAAYLEPNP